MHTLLSTNVTGIGGTDIPIVAWCGCIRAVIGVSRVNTCIGRTFTDVERGWIVIIALICVVTTCSHSGWVEHWQTGITGLGVRVTGVDGTDVGVIAVRVCHAAVRDNVRAETTLVSDAPI